MTRKNLKTGAISFWELPNLLLTTRHLSWKVSMSMENNLNSPLIM